MAINFPNSPVHGNTYDYLGVRYQYDGSTSPGFWKVVTVGTVSAATGAEVTTGTDNAKFVTPLAMEDSDYWSAHNDGAGSGLDADHVDGKSMAYVKSGRKNLLINGNFLVWQRGDSHTNPSNVYTTDRWMANASNCVLSKQGGIPGISRQVAAMTATGATNTCLISQAIEWSTVYPVKGKKVTLRFSYNSTVTQPASSLAVSLQKNATADTMLGGSWTTLAADSGAANYTPSNGLQTAVLVYTLPADATIEGLRVNIQTTNITNGSAVYIHNVQLEEGDEVTEFEQRPLGEELILCQRYYQKLEWKEQEATAVDNSQVWYMSRLPVEMRVPPAVTLNGVPTWWGGVTVTGSWAGATATTKGIRANAISFGTAPISGRSYWCNSSTTTPADLDAEL